MQALIMHCMSGESTAVFQNKQIQFEKISLLKYISTNKQMKSYCKKYYEFLSSLGLP